ncbi:MAG: hypothetical protein K0R57_2591 [Paenibacillaceae bacterium]|jgi:cell wall-associated NlpC family hydrolase|nr:hypothetical protein [Paenibacillaceae bacterium]
MRKHLHNTLLILVSTALVLTSGCGARRNKDSSGVYPKQANTLTERSRSNGPSAANAGNVTMLQNTGTSTDGILPLRYVDGEDYVQASKLMEVIGYKTDWDENQTVLKFGDNDAAFEVRMNSTQARREEDTLQLKKAPILIDGIPHLPVAALGDLLSDEIVFAKQEQCLILQPAPEQMELKVDEDGTVPQGDDLDFGDDAEDPYKNAANEQPTAGVPADEDGAVPAAALKDINIPALISRARTYLGVKYDFGADPYDKSGRFDCSSYTQYLFGKYGVSLPRLARSQAKLGNSISRSNLRVGDLLFFYVPGRFQTNKTVGHVGIYIGNKNMIHSSPEPKDGVQITNIDKAYWKRTFLYAKRIAD